LSAVSIKRGEIYQVNWNPGRGHEQKGERPALIIQNDIGNDKSPTTIVACCTTAPNKPYPFIVCYTASESGMTTDGAVDLAQIMTVDNVRLLYKRGCLNYNKMKEINVALKISLGIVT
jgi:mRNA interferase MazF